jgi:hypothetical protein
MSARSGFNLGVGFVFGVIAAGFLLLLLCGGCFVAGVATVPDPQLSSPPVTAPPATPQEEEGETTYWRAEPPPE